MKQFSWCVSAKPIGQIRRAKFRKRGSGQSRWLLLAWILWQAGWSSAWGVGFRLPNQDPYAIARGNAFVATADNPSAIYYNPAGITQIEGHSLQAGAYLLHVGVDYEAPNGFRTSNVSEIQAVPQLHYVFSPKDHPLSFGIGLYVPYGLSLKWPENTPFRSLAIEGQIKYITVNPVVAWQICPTLSIGVGPTFNYSEVQFKRGLFTSVFEIEGEGFDAGFDAGIRWQPHPKWALGAKYHYLTTISYSGHSKGVPGFPESTAHADIRFPQFVVAGISFRPNDKWNLEFNVDWTDWDNVNEIVFKDTPLTQLLGSDPVFPLHWQSSFMYEFGITRQLGKGYNASLGYFYSENSVPDATFNPIVPDTDLHLGSLGFGHRGKRWDWNIAYHFAISPTRTVTGNQQPPPTTETADGKYDVFNQAITASVLFRF